MASPKSTCRKVTLYDKMYSACAIKCRMPVSAVMLKDNENCTSRRMQRIRKETSGILIKPYLQPSLSW